MSICCRLLLPALTICTAVGCLPTANPYGRKPAAVTTAAIEDPRVVLDSSLGKDLVLTRVTLIPNATGRMRARIELENMTKGFLSISTKIEWYDIDNMIMVSAGGADKQESFDPRDTRELIFEAPSKDARNFRLMLQNPNN